jgi:enoyl-CoA hydratase/carnithine racemase
MDDSQTEAGRATVLYARDAHIATITLNRPERLNAFSHDMLHACADALRRAAADAEIRVIVIGGAGRAFCAGGDIKEMGQPETASARKAILWDSIQAVPKTLASIDKPVIAMINGDAVGGGLDIALMCDIRVAACHARLSEGYVRLGLVPGDGGAFLLPRLAPFGRALELLLTGELFDAVEAERLGIINHAVPAEELETVTYDLARRLASLPPLAVQLTKRLAYESLRLDLTTALDLASSHVLVVNQSEDHKEAVRAFREKRPGIYHAH